MGQTKHALIRYIALDKCFRNRGMRYYHDDLKDAVEEALSEYNSASNGISRSQLYQDINDMKDPLSYGAPIENIKEGRRVYYRYSDPNFTISNQPLNETEMKHLQSAMSVLSRFKGDQFQWIEELSPKIKEQMNTSFDGSQTVMSFEENKYLKNKGHLTGLFNAIINKRCLKLTYTKFGGNTRTHIISPQFLKQYNNRWFLVAATEEYDNMSNFAVDRIDAYEQTSDQYIETEINWDEYFEDIIGVTLNKGEPIEIQFEATERRAPYLKTKAIHASQTQIRSITDRSVFKIKVIPNREMYQRFLSFGPDITILSPANIRATMKELIDEMKASYS